MSSKQVDCCDNLERWFQPWSFCQSPSPIVDSQRLQRKRKYIYILKKNVFIEGTILDSGYRSGYTFRRLEPVWTNKREYQIIMWFLYKLYDFKHDLVQHSFLLTKPSFYFHFVIDDVHCIWVCNNFLMKILYQQTKIHLCASVGFSNYNTFTDGRSSTGIKTMLWKVYEALKSQCPIKSKLGKLQLSFWLSPLKRISVGFYTTPIPFNVLSTKEIYFLKFSQFWFYGTLTLKHWQK